MDRTKENFLGKGKKISATYDHPVPIDRLNMPLEKGSAIRVFCQGCSSLFGIGTSEASGLMGILSQKPEKEIESFSGHYFHVGACPFCDGDRSFAEIREIPKE